MFFTRMFNNSTPAAVATTAPTRINGSFEISEQHINNRDRFMQQARRPSLSRDTRDTRELNNNSNNNNNNNNMSLQQQQQSPPTLTTMSLKNNHHIEQSTTMQNLFKAEMITPQEHEEYFHQNIKQIAKIVCTDLIDELVAKLNVYKY